MPRRNRCAPVAGALSRLVAAVFLWGWLAVVPVLSAAAAPSDALRNLRDSDRKSEGGSCDAEQVWVGSLSLDGMPLYYPLHDPVALTPADPVKLRFQMWPTEASATVRYRFSHGAAYRTGGAWSDAPPPVRRNDPTGLDSPNNVSLEATLPPTGGSGATRVDYVVEAVLNRAGTTYRCQVVSNPFAFSGDGHVHSYVTTPKEKGRVYQMMVRNFAARMPPGGAVDERVGYANSGTFCQITDAIIDAIRELGSDTLWLSGIVDFDSSSDRRKGDAGSPYAVRNYYRVAADFACDSGGNHLYPKGTHDDAATAEATRQFVALVERIHVKGLRVMLDLVPNHTATVYDPITTRVWPWEPAPIQPGSHNYQYDYTATATRIVGNSQRVFPNSPGDWTDTFRLDYTNSHTAYGRIDPVTRRAIVAGNAFDNADPGTDGVASTYQMLDRVVETWQARGVDAFRVDFPHVLPGELWSYLIYNAKTRAAGFGRNAGDGARYPGNVFIIGEGYDLDGWFGPDSGAIGNAGANWANLLASGFDGIYDKNGLLDQARNVVLQGWWANGIGQKYADEINAPFDYRRRVGNIGPAGARIMVRMQSNHDEVQPASSEWSGGSGPNMLAAKAATAALLLLPGTVLIYNGHEVGEAAIVPSDRGRTSFFDYVVMPAVRNWLDGNLDHRQRALRRFYARLLILTSSFGDAGDPRGFGYYDLTQAAEWAGQPIAVQRWIHAYARVGGGKSRALVVANFSDAEQVVSLPLRPDGSTTMLGELGIRNDTTLYTFTEALATEDEDGNPRSVALSASGSDLHTSGTLTVTVPRWTASVLTVLP